MNLNHYIKKALSMSPQELTKKVVNKINTKLNDKLQRSKDLSKGTHIDFGVSLIQNSYINIKELDTSNIDTKVAQYLSQMYCEHRFDLLGSGWVKNSYDSVALGVEGYKYDMNVDILNSQFSILNYSPIDWQKDYKSGYRWSEKTWYKDHPLVHKLGVDIKVPWELARLQHLPQLAIFCLVDESLKEENIKEFKNQVLDFIANNPPRMGVNWVCTMDVGIRAANMLVAFDMFIQLDSFGILDNEFKRTFANSIYEHGLHIVNNLEYSEEFRSNHYLADISGLLYISAYLENIQEVNQWLAFSIQEIINEMNIEFYDDGGNFESSTSYHRLSGELIVCSTALILGLKKEKIKALQSYVTKGWKVKPELEPLENQQFKINNSTFKVELPQCYIDKLYKIGRFTVDITKPNGEIPQLGDNDSGRFFRFSPNGNFLSNKKAVQKYLNLKNYNEDDELFWDENILNHNTFISCFDGLFDDKIFNSDFSLEKSIVQYMAKKYLVLKNINYSDIAISKSMTKELKYKNEKIFVSKSKIENLRFIKYPLSGICIFKSDNMYLVICASSLHQMGNGHNHNDKLSFELYIDGEDLIKDAGTYLYTSLPNRRDQFRSVRAHNTIVFNLYEQNDMLSSFALKNETKIDLLSFTNNSIKLHITYKSFVHTREFILKDNSVKIIDEANKKFDINFNKLYSNGYGKRIS